jgi:hypothetical protein
MPKLRVSRATICTKVAGKFGRTSKTVKLQLSYLKVIIRFLNISKKAKRTVVVFW